MTSEYSEYDSYSADANNNVYTSVTVDGYAALHPTEYCPIPNGTYHYGRVYNMLGSTGGWVSGAEVCPGCYVSVINSQQAQILTPGQLLDAEEEGEVNCSEVGLLYLVNVARHFESAITADNATGPGTYEGQSGGYPVYDKPVAQDCSNGTPDYNPSMLTVNEPNAATDVFFEPHAILFRFLTSSTWSVLWPTGGAVTNGWPPPPTPPVPWCTHTGPQK